MGMRIGMNGLYRLRYNQEVEKLPFMEASNL